MGKRDWEVVKATGTLGGGRRGNGEVCGALIGALASLGLKYSRASEEEKENPIMFGYAIEFFKRFREEIVKNHSGIRCREITGLDFSKPEDVQVFYKGEKSVECTRIVGDTAKLVGEFLQRRT